MLTSIKVSTTARPFLFFLFGFNFVFGLIIRRYLNHHQELMNETGRNLSRRNFMDPNRGGMRNQYLNPFMNIPSIGN